MALAFGARVRVRARSHWRLVLALALAVAVLLAVAVFAAELVAVAEFVRFGVPALARSRAPVNAPRAPQTLHADASARALQPCRSSTNPRTSAS